MQPRRTCLALALLPLLQPLAAQAQLPTVSAAQLQALKLDSRGVQLDFPSVADTGASVPLQVQIEAPAGRKIQIIEVFLPENPSTLALKLRLIEAPARYAFGTRLRLAASQDAWVVATLDDGTRIGAHAPTVVVSSACFDPS